MNIHEEYDEQYFFVKFFDEKKIVFDLCFLSKLQLFKGPLSGLKQFLANESPLEMMKNAFYLSLRALLVLKLFKFLS